MKKVFLAVLLGISLPAAGICKLQSEVIWYHDGDKEPNTLQFKVEKVVGSQKDAEKLKASLKKVKGVKDVDVCTKSGTVKVKYTDELKSKDDILASVEKAGYKYELKSCCSGKEGEKKSCSSSEKKSCKDKIN